MITVDNLIEAAKRMRATRPHHPGEIHRVRIRPVYETRPIDELVDLGPIPEESLTFEACIAYGKLTWRLVEINNGRAHGN